MFLGMLLHRVWQLGMEKALFQDGVRPHLTLYYDRLVLYQNIVHLIDNFCRLNIYF